MTQKDRILARLRRGPVTNAELAETVCLRYGARLYDLRQAGHQITAEHVRGTNGLVRYRLITPTRTLIEETP